MNLEIDLGQAQTFTEIVLDSSLSIGDYLRTYAVQTSDDGTTWTDVAAGPGRAGVTVIALPATTTRYLRILSTGVLGQLVVDPRAEPPERHRRRSGHTRSRADRGPRNLGRRR